MLYYNRCGVPLISTQIFYIIWVFIDYAFYSTQIALFAWAIMERHILIFHDKWVSTRKKRFIFCENSFELFIVGSVYIPCIFSKTILGIWDLIYHQVIPIFIIVIFSITFL